MYTRILQILSTLQIPYIEIEHKPVYNTIVVMANIGLSILHETKSLAIEINNDILVITIRTSSRLTPAVIQKISGMKKIKLLDPEKMLKILQVPLGAVAPFGYQINIRCFVSNDCIAYEFFNFNPARNEKTLQIASKELSKLAHHDLIRLF